MIKTVGQIIPLIITPSEISSYILSCVQDTTNCKKMTHFINNLCLHDLWKNGSDLPYFALAFGAVFVFFEQMNNAEKIRRLVLLLNFDWRDSFKKLSFEVSIARARLVDSARFLTTDCHCIARFEQMMRYTFEDISAHFLKTADSFESRDQYYELSDTQYH